VVVLAKGCEEVVAYLLAASTHLGAEAAVLVVGSVQVALLGAGQAGHRTGFDACADDAKVGRRLPCQDAAGGVANVGAVKVEPYAPNQVGAVVLADTVVGAGGTASDAVETLLNAAQNQVAIQGCRVRMQLEYLWKDHVLPLSRSGSKAVQRGGWRARRWQELTAFETRDVGVGGRGRRGRR
jgi:hypothetical protein